VESLKKLNHWLYQIERVIVVVSLMVMSVVVFLSVVHRRYADPESILATKLAKLIGAERDTASWQTLQDIGGPLALVLLGAVIYLGFRTASRRSLFNRDGEAGKTRAQIHGEPLSHLQCAIYTVATVLVSWALLVLLFGTGKLEQSACIELRLAGDYSFHCGQFPAGLAWAQPLGLILTLWVAFVGASMATRDNLHLKVEAVQQAMPEQIKRISGLISGIITAGFCLLLGYLGYRYLLGEHEQWVVSNHLGGLHDGIEIPKFVSFSVVPLAYLIMAARFIGIGVLAFRGELVHNSAELRELEKHQGSAGSALEPEPEPELEPEPGRGDSPRDSADPSDDQEHGQ
jgi:TRAP-type C4-dicarboxylate transport system permease small subunit